MLSIAILINFLEARSRLVLLAKILRIDTKISCGLVIKLILQELKERFFINTNILNHSQKCSLFQVFS